MATAVVGLQFGDEGKGKLIDLLSSDFKHIIRAQGGNNAGHSVIVNGVEHHFHLVPSGILYPHTTCYLGAGVVIDPEGLEKELSTLKQHNIPFQGRLFISQYAHIVFPHHKQLDIAQEKNRKNAIGTTGKGIGPCYSDRISRVGMRVIDLLDTNHFNKMYPPLLDYVNQRLEMLGAPLVETEDFLSICESYRELLSPFVKDFEQEMLHQVDPGLILLEGAQGAFLDSTFGTYPYVTSSSTTVSGLCLGSGLPPTSLSNVVGVAKAYSTRVGNGPLVSEFESHEETILGSHKQVRETGTTTGRNRRMGWLDLVMLRYAVHLNGVNSLAVTKLDILDHLDEIKLCIAYEIDGEVTTKFPASLSNLESAKPVYETFKGWKTSTKDCKNIDDLPERAIEYLLKIEEYCSCKIQFLSVGPERERVITSLDLTKVNSKV